MTSNLHAGEWVEVRSADEILATLDESQALDGLPFMPEMLSYCGRRFRVYRSAHKTCDTIELYVIRRMADTVHLEDLRCSGEAHDGCQAACLIFWKTAWLKPVTDGTSVPSDVTESAGADQRETGPSASQLQRLNRATRVASADTAEPRYRCQATDLLKATSRVRRRERWDPRFYLKDLTSGNVGVLEFVWYGVVAAFSAFTLRWRGWRYPHLRGLAKDKTPTANLNLQPGELVQVRSKDEIMKTLTPGQRNRGLWFDVEMIQYCESSFRVLSKVDRLIDEKSGRMVNLPNPCLILDGVVCTGHYSTNRMFCPRAIYPYWREVWLKRVAPASDQT